jgi:transglutaminase-like putative cysteine protease
MRTVGIPARYVSGYLLTVPPVGQAKLIGADASHAWVGIYLPQFGWIDWDPTNNMRVDLDHITLAWGRDYADVPPIQGVFVGGGNTSLTVGVDVLLAKEAVLERAKTAE